LTAGIDVIQKISDNRKPSGERIGPIFIHFPIHCKETKDHEPIKYNYTHKATTKEEKATRKPNYQTCKRRMSVSPIS